jgi:charged multivesicular body protein 2A
MLRQNQRALNKAMRELDRERNRLEAQEKKIIADIKKMAKMNQMVGYLFCIIVERNYL